MIHPFQDGNGRLSRILTTFLLRQAGYDYVPYSSLESVVEANKNAYHVSLRQTQGTIHTESPDWQRWLYFFMRSLQQQIARLEKKIERGRVTVADAANVTGANRHTVKGHLNTLTKANHLERHSAGRGSWCSFATG